VPNTPQHQPAPDPSAAAPNPATRAMGALRDALAGLPKLPNLPDLPSEAAIDRLIGETRRKAHAL